MDPELRTQLDRIEGRLDQINGTTESLWDRVVHLERRATLWGSMAGVIVTIAGKLTGCG
jgi:hypothetical protein